MKLVVKHIYHTVTIHFSLITGIIECITRCSAKNFKAEGGGRVKFPRVI